MSLLYHTGCSAARKLEPAPPTEFLNIPGVDRQGTLENLPFDHAWVAEDFNEKQYSKIIVSPVSTAYLTEKNQLESTSVFVPTKEAYDEEVKLLAEFTALAFRKAFSEDPDKRMQVVEEPGPGTLLLEIALTQVIFGHPGAYAGSFASPLPGTGAIAAAITQPTVAFEARLKDAETGRILATAADRRTPAIRIVDFNQLTAVSPCRDIVDTWADLMVDVFKEGRLRKVKAPWFRFSLW